MTFTSWRLLTLKRSRFVQVVFAHYYFTKEQRPSGASLVINVPATGRRRRENNACVQVPLLLRRIPSFHPRQPVFPDCANISTERQIERPPFACLIAVFLSRISHRVGGLTKDLPSRPVCADLATLSIH